MTEPELADIEEVDEESKDGLCFTTSVKLGKRRLTLNLEPTKKKKPLTVKEKVDLVHKLEYSPSECTYTLLEEAGWLRAFVVEATLLEQSTFQFLEQCKCSNASAPKEALLAFRASTQTSNEASVVQAMSRSIVHLVEELNSVYGTKTFVFANEWPVGPKRRRTDLAIFKIRNFRTYVIIEVKESIPMSLLKSEMKKIIPQLIFEMVLVSTTEKAGPGTKYLGVICDDYSFHSFELTMNSTTTFELVVESPMTARPFTLSGYASASGKEGEALEPLCKVIQSFVQATTPPPP